MTHRRRRDILMGLAALGLAASFWAFLAGAQTDTLLGFVLAVGLILAGIAILVAGIVQHQLLRQQRLLRGEGVVARWIIDQACWENFVRRDDALSAQQPSPPNFLKRPRRFPNEGLAVSIGQQELQVGDDFHMFAAEHVEDARLLPGQPMCFELVIYAHDPNGSNVRWCLRIPVPLSARDEAETACRHFAMRHGQA